MTQAPFLSEHEQTLHEQYQDAIRRYFEKRHDMRGVKLTPDQEAAKAESNRLERELGQTRICEIHNALCAQHKAMDAARCAEAREEARAKLNEAGLRPGMRMHFAAGALGSLLGSRGREGTLKISKRGDPYVSGPGGPYALWGWRPVTPSA